MADWTIDIPSDLWKGLLYSVAIATWREALRESRWLGFRLKGFRPETIPVKELDRLVLRGLDEDPELRDVALERFAVENAGLIAALEANGPAAVAAEALDPLLRDECAARVFWAAFRGGDAWAPVRDAVLQRVRAGRLDGAPLFPPRLERRPKAPPPAAAPGTPAPPAAAPPPPAAADPVPLAGALRKAERELARAREDRDRLQDELKRLEETEVRLLADRERLERSLEEARAAAPASAGPDGRRAPAGGDRRAVEHEVARLRTELAEERRRAAAALHRSRTFKRELDAVRSRLDYHESIDVKDTYPKEPAGVSPRSEAEKIVWPSDEHHYPKRLRPFLERLARSPYVDRIHIREFEDSTETRVKGVDERGNVLLQFSDGLKAVRLYLTTVAKDANEGRWVADRLRELEPSLS